MLKNNNVATSANSVNDSNGSFFCYTNLANCKKTIVDSVLKRPS
ncbi:MAG TPA: hypothetical protein VF273_10580 [Pelobium sp.]